VFLYNRAVRALRDIASREAFGPLRYMYARRTNFGPVRQDVHAGWDLAAHDVSIFIYVKGRTPVEVTASSQAYLQRGIPDVVFATLYFDDDTVAHLHTSWLDPQKVRQVTLVGENQMAIFDDMSLGEPLRIHNKRCRLTDSSDDQRLVDTFGGFRVDLLSGDVIIPPVATGEPLRNECEAFLDAIATGERPLSDGAMGVEVVRVLAAMDRSMAERSRRVEV